MSLNTLICKFFSHNWTEEDHRPCMKFKRCRRCRTEEVNRGWHRFSNWNAPYGVQVYERRNDKDVTVNQNRQQRTCSDCNFVDERVVLF